MSGHSRQHLRWAFLAFCVSALAAIGQEAPAAPSSLAQPSPTSPVSPGQGVTISAATGLVVTNQSAPAPARTLTNAPIPGLIATDGRTGTLAPGSSMPTTGRSNITPVQLQNINRLVTDLNALGMTTKDPAEQHRNLKDALEAAPVTQVRPPAEMIAQLTDNLVTVVPTLNLTAPQRRQLAIDLNLALNSASLSREEAQRVVADVRAVLRGGLLKNPEAVEQLISQFTGIISQVQSAAGGTGTAPLRNPGATLPSQTGQSAGSQTGQGADASPSAPNPGSPPRL